LFDLSAAQSVSISDLSVMLLNLPLEALIVDFTGFKSSNKQRYRIIKAPQDTEGIRRKRKLLA